MDGVRALYLLDDSALSAGAQMAVYAFARYQLEYGARSDKYTFLFVMCVHLDRVYRQWIDEWSSHSEEVVHDRLLLKVS